MHARRKDGHTRSRSRWRPSWQRGARRRCRAPTSFLFQPAEEVLAGDRTRTQGVVCSTIRGWTRSRPAPHAQQPVGQVQVSPRAVHGSERRVHRRGARIRRPRGRCRHLRAITSRGRQHRSHAALNIARGVPAQDTAVAHVGRIVSGTKGPHQQDTRDHEKGKIRAFEQSVRDQYGLPARSVRADIAKAIARSGRRA